MDSIWFSMIQLAKSKIAPRKINDFVSAGEVAACVLGESGKYYKGICIDTACSLGMCAERNALAHMLTHGEERITRLVCIDDDGVILPPCGVCREAIKQLDPIFNGSCEVLLSIEPFKTSTIDELLPAWWGNKF